MKSLLILAAALLLISSAATNPLLDDKEALLTEAKNKVASNDLKALDKGDWPKQIKNGFACTKCSGSLAKIVINEKKGGSGCSDPGHGTYVEYCQKDKIYFIYKWSGGFVFRQDFYGPFDFPVSTESSTDTKADFDVHEWGVFMFYQGVGTDLLTGNDDLPSFVVRADRPHDKDCTCDKCKEVKAKCPVCGGVKGKCMCNLVQPLKPVINFYTDKELDVKLSVKFNNGKHTVWFPKHTTVSKSGDELKWEIRLTQKPFKALSDSKESSWWNTARETDSAYIATKDGVTEKFLFYEGESTTLKSSIELKCVDGKVKLSNRSKIKYTNLFIVKDGKIKQLAEFTADEIDFKETIDAKSASDELEKLLLKDGLNDKEAAGIAKIWQKEFFERDGTRVIYMMTRDEIDSALPLQISPKPKSIKRAMIACVQDTNGLVEKLIAKLSDDDPKTRDEATAVLTRLGKPILPLLEKALKLTKDAESKSRLENIINEIKKASSGLNDNDKKWVKDGTCSCELPSCVVMTPITCKRCSKTDTSMNRTLCNTCIDELKICPFCFKKKQ